MVKFQNVVFDFDSTLTSIEGLDTLAEKHGVLDSVRSVTASGMNGEITFDKSLRRRLALLNVTERDFIWLAQRYRRSLVSGVRKLLKTLHEKKVNVYVVTGGPRPAIENLARELGIPKANIWATCFKIDKQGMAKLDETCIMSTKNGKEKVVTTIAKSGKTVVIGDGMTDYEAAKRADLFIGYGGIVKREAVKAKSKIYVEAKNLNAIAKYLIQDTIY